ncbi:choline/carnitine/betaine transporter family protein [Pseudomonas sp. TCU-HL1]|nr:choline/carnitine/betaine transporter family protein [Pseudomonas sp. TCU-HL1]
MRAELGLFKGLNPTVTLSSVLIVIVFVVSCVLQAEQAGEVFKAMSEFVVQQFKWFYLSLVTGVLGCRFTWP